jgi:hypothetical protein
MVAVPARKTAWRLEADQPVPPGFGGLKAPPILSPPLPLRDARRAGFGVLMVAPVLIHRGLARRQKSLTISCEAFSIGSPGRARTADPVINSHLLYRLSYRGIALVMSFWAAKAPNVKIS